MFPFLIGRIRTYTRKYFRTDGNMFPFLIGRIRTIKNWFGYEVT